MRGFLLGTSVVANGTGCLVVITCPKGYAFYVIHLSFLRDGVDEGSHKFPI